MAALPGCPAASSAWRWDDKGQRSGEGSGVKVPLVTTAQPSGENEMGSLYALEPRWNVPRNTTGERADDTGRRSDSEESGATAETSRTAPTTSTTKRTPRMT